MRSWLLWFRKWLRWPPPSWKHWIRRSALLGAILALFNVVLAMIQIALGLSSAGNPSGTSFPWWWWPLWAIGVSLSGLVWYSLARANEAEEHAHTEERFRRIGEHILADGTYGLALASNETLARLSPLIQQMHDANAGKLQQQLEQLGLEKGQIEQVKDNLFQMLWWTYDQLDATIFNEQLGLDTLGPIPLLTVDDTLTPEARFAEIRRLIREHDGKRKKLQILAWHGPIKMSPGDTIMLKPIRNPEEPPST